MGFGERTVYAWRSDSVDGRSGWKQGRYPLPDVLYENYPVGMPAPRLRAKAVKRKIAALGIPVFNPVFFSLILLKLSVINMAFSEFIKI